MFCGERTDRSLAPGVPKHYISRAGLRGACGAIFPGALSILTGAVPVRARGLGHMAPTYLRREPGIELPRPSWLRTCFCCPGHGRRLRRVEFLRDPTILSKRWVRKRSTQPTTTAPRTDFGREARIIDDQHCYRRRQGHAPPGGAGAT